jgi:hypothetical protein
MTMQMQMQMQVARLMDGCVLRHRNLVAARRQRRELERSRTSSSSDPPLAIAKSQPASQLDRGSNSFRLVSVSAGCCCFFRLQVRHQGVP